MNERRALQNSREDLCFAVDVLISEARHSVSSPYIWRLLGTVDFITETLGDAEEFAKTVLAWENMHDSRLREAIRAYPNFRSKVV